MSQVQTKALSITLLFLVAVLIGACATRAPVQEMSDARQAVAAAGDIGAKEYYPEVYEEAAMRLESAEKNMQQGIYWAAKRDADAAKDFAVDALLSTRRRLEENASGQSDAEQSGATPDSP